MALWEALPLLTTQCVLLANEVDQWEPGKAAFSNITNGKNVSFCKGIKKKKVAFLVKVFLGGRVVGGCFQVDQAPSTGLDLLTDKSISTGPHSRCLDSANRLNGRMLFRSHRLETCDKLMVKFCNGMNFPWWQRNLNPWFISASFECSLIWTRDFKYPSEVLLNLGSGVALNYSITLEHSRSKDGDETLQLSYYTFQLLNPTFICMCCGTGRE